jgi:hypothetical protein
VLAANGPEKDGVPSPTAWIVLLQPTVPILLMIYAIFRNARRNQAMAERSVARFEDHRRFTEEHMKRVELQIDRLNENLSRVIDLLEAVERGQRQGRT